MSVTLSKSQGVRLVRFARETIGYRLGLIDNVDQTGLEQEEFKQELATFVTLKIKGNLRGCIGNLSASEGVTESLARNALSAAFHDHRFTPLTEDEFGIISVELSILTTPSPLDYQGPDDLVNRLRPHVDGVILKIGRNQATFLPQVWEQLPDPFQFLEHLCLKAGLSPTAWREENPDILVYQVQHFTEDNDVTGT